MNDAHVVCRQLGFKRAIKALTEVYVPEFHTGWVDRNVRWLDDVNCAGTEKKLGSCRLSFWGRYNCGYENIAGVECLEGKIIPKNLASLNSHALHYFECTNIKAILHYTIFARAGGANL